MGRLVTVFTQVLSGSIDKVGIMSQMTNGGVAGVAQQSPNLSGVMAVVNGEHPCGPGLPGNTFGLTANRTAVVLRLGHLIVLLKRQTVVALQHRAPGSECGIPPHFRRIHRVLDHARVPRFSFPTLALPVAFAPFEVPVQVLPSLGVFARLAPVAMPGLLVPVHRELRKWLGLAAAATSSHGESIPSIHPHTQGAI